MGWFDWLKRRGPEPPVVWSVHVDGGDVVIDDGRGHVQRAAIGGAQNVRVVPLTGGSHHVTTSGWQVTLSRPEGDVLVGKPIHDWRSARDLARLICDRAELSLDELSQRMFSRVS